MVFNEVNIMNESIKVTSIEVTRKNGETIVLTVSEARDLFDQLEEIFGEPKERTAVLPYPMYIERADPYWNRQIRCSSGNTSAVKMRNCGGQTTVVLKGV